MPAAINPVEHYTAVTESGCWLWEGKVRPDGYGSHRSGLAHRLSYAHHKGQIPDGHLVCHKCDTRLCINPDHLFAGPHSANHEDMRIKGRQAHGSKHGMAKLGEADVERIRSMLSKGISQSKIASEYGISQPMVSRIHARKAWYGGKHAKMGEI